MAAASRKTPNAVITTGMIIMRDRAQSLRGDCQVRRRETGGTEVTVTFIPETNFTETQGDTHE
ncbi:hypothetical protein LFZ31_21335 [Salmonella enterica subsp. enterica serovar Newport str. S09097]|nr:hypothetical protein LFZ31_21335 [Salmonella enterica subsp. enterica serovar Newport str. S09097]